MAGGGIVAFDGGGEVPRYQSAGLVSPSPEITRILQKSPYERTPADNAALEQAGYTMHRKVIPPDSGIAQANTWLSNLGPRIRNYFTEGASQLSDAELAQRQNMGATNERILRSLGSQPSPFVQPPQPVQPQTPDYTQDLAPGMTAAMPLKAGEEGEKPPEDKKAPPAAVPTAVPQVAAPRLNTAGIAALPTDTATIADELKKIQPAYPTALPEAQQKGIDELTKAEQALVDKNLADIEAEQKNRAPALKDFEKLLNDRKARIEGREKDLAPMALLQAGLSIMAGTSPYALVNVGAGATVGMEAYRKGADKLEEARDKMDEGFAKIEEVRRNESRMDAKELRQARMDAMRPQIEAKKLAINALNENWKLSITQATNIFNQMSQDRRTFYEQASQNVRAQLQADTSVTTANINAQTQRDVAGMPGANERLYSRLGNGDVAKGLKLFAESMGYGGDKTSLAALKDYTGPLGEAKLKKLEQGTPEERLTAMQIRNKLKELGGIGRIAPVNVDNALP